MKKIILIPVFSLFCLFSFGQNAKIDSLISVLKTAKEDTNKVIALNILSWELIKTGDYEKAKQFATSSLSLSQKIKFKKGEAKANNQVGLAYMDQGNYPDALTYYFKGLKITEELRDKNGIEIYLGNIGLVYWNQGDYPNALDHYFKALKLAEELGDKNGVVRHLGNIGLVFDDRGDYPKALEYLLKALKIVEELRDKNGIEINLGNIGLVYWNQGDYPKALDHYFKALKLAEELGDKNGEARHLGNIGLVFDDRGDYPKALDYYLNALKVTEGLGEKKEIARHLGNIGILYQEQKDYINALEYYSKALEIEEELGDKYSISGNLHNIGSIFKEQGNYPRALEYSLKAMKINEEIGNKKWVAFNLQNIGGIYADQCNYPEALKNYYASLKIEEEIGNKDVVNTYIGIGEIFTKQKKTSIASGYLRKSLSLAKEIGSLEGIKDSYDYLIKLDSAMGNWKDAFEYHKLYVIYQDSLINKENTKKIVQSQMQYDFDKKEAATKAETDKKEALAKAEISKQKIILNSITGGTGILVISSIFSFMFYKRKREASFKNEVSEVEMKALRSQMNPHFIFNSLNSIKRYMANHDNKTAEDYLTKFANVMRLILENSEHKEVPLQQDLKALELYMQLESLRMKKKFQYEIKVDENIDAENTLIPPLILQPFVENSIWHGLAGKEGEGKISISINRVGEMIECIVEDNGVGREKAKTDNPEGASAEKKSLGMKITNARIDILNKIKKSKAGVELVDLAEGMRVVVKLPLELSF